MISSAIIIALSFMTLSYVIAYLIDKFILSKKATNSYAYTIVSVSIYWVETLILSLFLSWNEFPFQYSWIPFTAGLISGLFYIAYFWLLNKEEASAIVPLMYLTPIGLLMIHYVLFNTTFTSIQLAGIVGAILGVIVLESKHTLKQFLHSKATLLGIAYGILVAIPIAINESATKTLPYWNMQIFFSTGALITVLLLLFRKDVRKTLFQHYKLFKYTIIAEAATVIGHASLWYGFTLVTSPLFEGMGQIIPLILFATTTIISRYYPHIITEDQTRTTLIRKALAITLIVAGTGMLVYTV